MVEIYDVIVRKLYEKYQLFFMDQDLSSKKDVFFCMILALISTKEQSTGMDKTDLLTRL